MTKKDYALIAEAISTMRDTHARRTAAETLAVYLALDNVRFDSVKFINVATAPANERNTR